MRLSNLIAWIVVLALLFWPARKVVAAPLMGIFVALAAIAFGTRNNNRPDNHGL